MNSDPKQENRCQATKPDGLQCEAACITGELFCFFHHPEMAKQREGARRAGGIERSRRLAVLPPDTPDRLLRNSTEVVELLRDVMNKVLRESSIIELPIRKLA